MGFLDIHNHMLPGIDDGSRNADESASMAQALYEAGVDEIVVTPHFEVGLYFNTRDKILREWEKLQKEFISRDIKTILYPGSEVMITPEVPDLLKE
jgi:protein-tyrosine phosphatase